MCGIFGYVGKSNNAAEIVFSGLKCLEYRGYDSWGVGTKVGDRIIIDKHVGKIGNAKISLPKSTLACGHTRWATHGGVTDINAHPHLDCSGKIAVMHNGIVENYLVLKKELVGKKHHFISETDTETVVHLIEEYERSFPFEEAVRLAFKRLEGRNAIIAVSVKDDSIVVAKNGSPIVLGIGNGENFIASDFWALIPYTKRVIFLEDGQITKVTNDNIRILSIDSAKQVKGKELDVEWEVENVEKGTYKHFLLKEIMEQGRTIAAAVAQDKNQIKKVSEMIKKSKGAYFVGCGTAAHACREATYIFSKIAKMHINFCVGSEFSYFSDFLKPDSLLVAASQSGETADILEAVSSARRKKSKVISLVNVAGSSLWRASDMQIPLRVGPERSVLSTKAFTGKLALFYLIAYIIAGKYEYGRKILLKTSKSVEKLLTDRKFIKKIKDIAEKIYKKNDLYVIGRGLHFPIALEAAHKIKEASYIHAEGFAGGEPKHCEISLISKGVPCLVFAPNDETRAAILSNAMEFKARGGYIIGISPNNEEVFDDWIKIPYLGITSPIISIIPAQLLAYYLALRRGCDPDKPRNLAKSVTVK